jgi:isochorismate synthase
MPEKLQQLTSFFGQWKQQKAFALFRLPGSKEIHLWSGPTLDRDCESEAFFEWVPFHDDTPSFRIDAGLQDYWGVEEFRQLCEPITQGFTLHIEENVEEEGKEEYLKGLQRCLHELNTGVLEKVVFSRRVSLKAKAHPLELFMKALSKYETAFCYWFHHPKAGCWLGASPEILVKSKGEALETFSLAGTQKANGGEAPVWTAKEKREQGLVTQYIQQLLQGKVDDLKLEGPFDARAGQLWHLKTVVRAKTRLKAVDIARSLHPSPAVCGLPKDKAKAFLKEVEGYDRAYYTGYLGPVKTVSADLFVNLRCLEWKPDEVRIYVGGGITSESMPEKEWEETCHKMKTMLELFRD